MSDRLTRYVPPSATKTGEGCNPENVNIEGLLADFLLFTTVLPLSALTRCAPFLFKALPHYPASSKTEYLY
jgi:hypothetical protein